MLRYRRILQEFVFREAVESDAKAFDDAVECGHTLTDFLVEDLENYSHTNFR